MTEYKIERWDVLLVNDHRVPAIYIKPDLDFLNLAKKNNNYLTSVINGTKLSYDGQQITGVVNQSGSYPNCRPNFFKEEGLYIFTLNSSWLGYPAPDSLGTVKFSGIY
jgi:hypothetical protein